jgi:phosphoglycolate phosphatase
LKTDTEPALSHLAAPTFRGKRCVVFDFDLTLADSTEGAVQTINAVLAVAGRPPATRDAIRRTIGRSLRETFATLTGAGEDELARLVALFRGESDKHMTPNTTLLKGAAECVHRMKHAGLRLGIVSTKYRFRIAEILTRDGLFEEFDGIVGGDDVHVPKPDPEGLIALLERFDVPLGATVCVGDSTVDAELAQRAGVDFVAVLTGATTRTDFGERPVCRFVTDLLELAALVPLSVRS